MRGFVLLRLEECVEMRTIQRSHPNLITLAGRFGCLPVLDELSRSSVVAQARTTRRRKFHVGSDTGARARYFCNGECLHVRHGFPFDATREDVELQRHCRSTLY